MDGAAQLCHQRQPAGAAALELGMVLHHRAARGLGGGHRDVRMAQQLVRVLAAIGKGGHAHAGPDVQRLTLDLKRFLHRLQERGAFAVGVAVTHPGKQGGKRIAGETGHDLTVGRLSFQAQGNLLQEQIPGAVAEGVVHLPEMIETEADHGERCGRWPSRQALNPLADQSPVREPGQRIVGRLVLQRAPRRLTVRHVLRQREHQRSATSLKAQVGPLQLDPPAVLSQDGCLEASGALALQSLFQIRGQG